MQNASLRPKRTLGVAAATASASLLLLTGCEAPLNLDAVRDVAEQASQRTDFYQAMATNQSVIVVSGNEGVLLSSEDQGASWTRQASHCITGQFKGQVYPEMSPPQMFNVQHLRATGS